MIEKYFEPTFSNSLIPREEQGKHRVGIIPYCVYRNKIMFCLGIDTKSKDLTDFAGGLKKRESITEGAMREFKEESGPFFRELWDKIDLTKTLVLHSSVIKMTVFFLPVPNHFVNRDFSIPLSEEIITLKWINLSSITKYKIYSKLNKFLHHHIIPNLSFLSPILKNLSDSFI